MEVEVELWAWTVNGMRRTNGSTEDTQYVTRRDCERLLEEADERRRLAMIAHFREGAL